MADPDQRRRLPATRDSITHKFSINGHEGYLTVGMFEDGTPGELFINMAKEGSTVGGLMDGIGVLTSMALQHGVPVESLAAKLEQTRFEPMEHNKATSVLDYIFRWLRETFSPEEMARRRGEDIVPPSDPAA